MLLILVSERLPFCVTQLVLFHLVLFFWNQLTALSEGCLYMSVSRCQKAGQRQSIKIANEDIKSRLNSGNACYHSVQSILSSHLLFRYVKFKIYQLFCMGVKFGLSH
jgi:hypothetical protein